MHGTSTCYEFGSLGVCEEVTLTFRGLQFGTGAMGSAPYSST